ncbi:synaptopodin-2 [Chanos chanos]|uniref:Synaptopodin-2 n=1 Tax=Chanos chanos TaxID=29144 RepID=A0A6J2WIG0_CHACN|nr:synaptopodin-2 [Chanos chanos]
MEPAVEVQSGPEPETCSSSDSHEDLRSTQEESYDGESGSDTNPQKHTTHQLDRNQDRVNSRTTAEVNSLVCASIPLGEKRDHADFTSNPLTLTPICSLPPASSTDSSTPASPLSDHDPQPGQTGHDLFEYPSSSSSSSSSPGLAPAPPPPRKEYPRWSPVLSRQRSGELPLRENSPEPASAGQDSDRESLSEKQQKEAKSKCKRIALLLTAAPNPRSRGVLMFKKRRQRVKKYTLVSYGTGETELANEEDKYTYKGIRFPLSASSDSEFEDEFSFNAHGQGFALNLNSLDWHCRQAGVERAGNCEEMEHLPETKGKGVLMFAQRRQRTDEIAAQHEEMRSKGLPVEAFEESRPVQRMKSFTPEPSVPDQAYVDVHVKQQTQLQEEHHHQQHHNQQQYQQQTFPQPANGLNDVDALQSKGLVPNRTAKPFLSGLNRAPAPYSPIRGVTSPPPKKPENIFKVPVPVNTTPQVWSPTGDIIASRDERIAVPAIKTGVMPDSKRRGGNKAPTDSKELHKGNTQQRKSFVESGAEEDYLSLGAEACNFMQAPTIRHKHPPPVAPKPAINPACPPWSAEGHARAPRSPIPASDAAPAPSPAQDYSAPQQNWAPPQPVSKPWTPSPTPAQHQQPVASWAPTSNQPTPYQPIWSPEPQPNPVSIQTRSAPQVAPTHSKVPWTKTQYDRNSVTSCPPQRGTSYFHASKAPTASPKGYASDAGACQPSDGPNFKGRGAELFARRQSRMEKFVVDAETVQANRARSPSPTHSMPSTWKYSSNIRAPPPASYNPILSPFYPPAALKQPPATSPKLLSKANKEKPKPAPKHLNVLDVMKHQPYQLDASLFTYNSIPEIKSPSSPVPPAEPKRGPGHAPAHIKTHSPAGDPSPTFAPSPIPSSGTAQPNLASPAKPSGPVFGRSRSLSLPRRLSSMSSPALLPSMSSSGYNPPQGPYERQGSWLDQPNKSPSPWEAAARSPLGLVDEAFAFQNIPPPTAPHVRPAAHRKSLPEPPTEGWKRRVSFEPIVSPQATVPTLAFTPAAEPTPVPAIKSPSKTIPSSPVPTSDQQPVYGPPFKPAQPLWSNDKISGTRSLPRGISLHSPSTASPKESWM